MRAVVIAGLLVGACTQPSQTPTENTQPSEDASAAGGWRLQMADTGPSLVLAGGDGAAEIRIICRPGQQLLVNVPGFAPIGSEERLSFGQGGEVVALVADVRGDRERGGVTGEGALPDNLAELLSGQVSASYGAQTSGPHRQAPPALVDAFASGCNARAGGATEAPAAKPTGSSACLSTQDGQPVPPNSIKAVGTEPFWAARVQGRCVTYSHPEDQSGTRVWTTFSGTAANGTWTGALNGQPFVMKTTPKPGCSDGMSDKRYPIAVSLTVGGEQRSGCAEPA